MNLDLSGKTALVVASSRGLGKAVAAVLASEGCRVMLSGRDAAVLRAAVSELDTQTGAMLAGQPCDITRPDDIHRLVEATRRELGPIDILVNNCGGPPGGTFADCDDAAWTKAFELTLLSYVRLVRAALPDLQASRGRIANIASSSIRQPIANLTLSNVMRAGVLGLGKSLADELAPFGILVNTVAPGRIATDRTTYLDTLKAERQGRSAAEVRSEACRLIPLGRYGEPAEFARVVAFLVSGANTYLTGQAIAVDGGLIRAL